VAGGRAGEVAGGGGARTPVEGVGGGPRVWGCRVGVPISGPSGGGVVTFEPVCLEDHVCMVGMGVDVPYRGTRPDLTMSSQKSCGVN